MRRGIKPTPTVLRDRLVDQRAERQPNPNEPKPSHEISLEPPSWAKLSDAGKKVWYRLAPMVHRNGLLTEADIMQFARYCDMLPRWIEAKDYIDENGETYDVVEPVYEGSGREKQVVDYKLRSVNLHPAAKRYLEYNKALQSLECEFGMSPSSRTRISALNGESESELDFFFRTPGKKSKAQ